MIKNIIICGLLVIIISLSFLVFNNINIEYEEAIMNPTNEITEVAVNNNRVYMPHYYSRDEFEQNINSTDLYEKYSWLMYRDKCFLVNYFLADGRWLV